MPLEIIKGFDEVIHEGYADKPQHRLLPRKKWDMLLDLLEEVAENNPHDTRFDVWNKVDGPATIRGLVTKESAPELYDPAWRKKHGYPIPRK